jgi:hypothetical protein
MADTEELSTLPFPSLVIALDMGRWLDMLLLRLALWLFKRELDYWSHTTQC